MKSKLQFWKAEQEHESKNDAEAAISNIKKTNVSNDKHKKRELKNIRTRIREAREMRRRRINETQERLKKKLRGHIKIR